MGWDAFVAAFDLLLSKDANVNGLAVKDGSTVLIQARKLSLIRGDSPGWSMTDGVTSCREFKESTWQ